MSKFNDMRREASLRKRKAFVELMRTGSSIKEACTEVGISRSNYEFWRTSDKRFVGAVDRARLEWLTSIGMTLPDRPVSAGFDFAAERLYWFGHESPWFQLEIISAIEHLPPGHILLVLLPPGHGKTTLYEDFVTLRLGHNPSLRNHVGSESQSLSKKILHRVRSRLDPIPGWTKMEEFVMAYGPFAPPKDETRRQGQAWTGTHFDIWRKREFDERDFSMAALGFGSQIIGSRSDHLHVDDVQSMKTLAQTESYVDQFTQDWLSRPLDQGITDIMGNRIDEGDFYEGVMDSIPSDILHVIRYPALYDYGTPQSPDVRPLWEERFSAEGIEQMRAKVGDVRFARNWQQRPRAVRMKTFDEDTVTKTFLPLRSLGTVQEGKAHVVGLDPGFGTSAIAACQLDDNGMTVTQLREDRGFYNNEQVLNAVRDVMADIVRRGGIVTDLVIESNAYQKGLMRDPQTLRLQDHYGCAIRPHQTSGDRNDENIGIPSMVHTMNRGELHIPYADDDHTRFWVDELKAQLLAWKPKVPGSRLRMDLLMALYFCWVLWRNRGGVFTPSPMDWTTANKSPYNSGRGLVLPRGYNPVLTRSR